MPGKKAAVGKKIFSAGFEPTSLFFYRLVQVFCYKSGYGVPTPTQAKIELMHSIRESGYVGHFEGQKCIGGHWQTAFHLGCATMKKNSLPKFISC